MGNRYFPIHTATACRLKWSWSSLYLNKARTTSCHRASLSDLTQENFFDFHNTPVKVAAREAMLRGEWPGGGCEYCMEIENSGGTSDRIWQNRVPDVYPAILDTDPTKIQVEPTVLEVFFANTCNLKCVYCEAGLSSAIQAEDRRFGGPILARDDLARDDEPQHNHYPELVSLFWQWMQEHGHGLRRLQILGGEPLLQDDFYDLITFFEENPNPNLEFNVITNLNLPSSVIERTTARLENLIDRGYVGRIDIHASVDCWSHTQNYIRWGFNSDLFERNLRTLMSSRRFRIALLSTVTSLSIPDMPALADKYNEWNQEQEIFWYMALVLPSNGIMSPVIFDTKLFVNNLIRVYSKIPSTTWDQKQTLGVLSGIMSKVQNQRKDDIGKQQQLMAYLNEVDRRRGGHWHDNFPWLLKLMESNHVV